MGGEPLRLLGEGVPGHLLGLVGGEEVPEVLGQLWSVGTGESESKIECVLTVLVRVQVLIYWEYYMVISSF